MRYGICTGLENLKLLEQLGYDYIEVSVAAVMKLTGEELERYREELRTSAISCEVFNVLFPKTMELIGEHSDKESLRVYLNRAMGLMETLGGKVAVFGSGRCRCCPKGMTYREAYRKLTEVYRTTGEIAAQYGIIVVIEPLSRSETNMICTMAEGAALEEAVSHPNVRLLSDYYHVVANHDRIEDIRTIKKFGHIHIASGNGRRYPLPGEGEAYEVFMAALKSVGYNGRISIEGKTDDMAGDSGRALEYLKELEKTVYE